MRWFCALVWLTIPAAAFAQEAPSEPGSRAPEAGLAIDWTSGPTFGDVPTLGGAHGLGIEGRLAAFGSLELDARYELLAIALPGDMGTDLSHQLLGQLKVRWITDDARRQLWVIGAGYGTAFRPGTLGGSAALGRISLARQIGIPTSRWDTAFELAYERSFGDTRLEMALAGIRLGVSSGRRSRYLGAKAPLFARTTSLDLFAPAGVGMSFGLHANRNLSLETSGNFIADVDIGLNSDTSFHGFRDAQWAVQMGPRFQHSRWPAEWAPIYAQVQAGVGWIARDPGVLRAVQTAELGVRLVCSDFGADFGAWIRTQVADGALDPIAGGLVLKFVVATDRIVIGGRNRTCADSRSSDGAAGHGQTKHIVSTGGSNAGGANVPPPNLGVQGQVGVRINVQGVLQALSPPPAPRAEQVGTRPGHVWIAGHWEWRGGTWRWVGGRWESERTNMRWSPGTYQVQGGVYVWIEGHWTAR
jgi:hypothetical protein